MLYFMNSKVFRDVFIPLEKRKDILDAQYVLISTKIKVRSRDKCKNVIIAKTNLYPNIKCLNNIDDVDDYKEAYFEQMEENKGLLASLIVGSIKKGYNIIFMCTPNESKLGFFEMLREYIFYTFDYMLYDYKMCADGTHKTYEYNEKKVLKRCKKILNEVSEENYKEKRKTSRGREELMSGYRKMNKKQLKKKLKEIELYRKGMSKSEMLDMIDAFL